MWDMWDIRRSDCHHYQETPSHKATAKLSQTSVAMNCGFELQCAKQPSPTTICVLGDVTCKRYCPHIYTNSSYYPGTPSVLSANGHFHPLHLEKLFKHFKWASSQTKLSYLCLFANIHESSPNRNHSQS